MLTLIAAFVVSVAAYGADSMSDNSVDAALTKTQQVMRSPTLRNQALQNDPQALNLDQGLERLGPGVKDQLYDMAADLMATVVKEANGDPEKMQKMLVEYQSNPAAFYQKMTPDQKQRVRDVAGQVESASPRGVRAGAR